MNTPMERMTSYMNAITPAKPEFYTANSVVHETPILKLRMFRHDTSAEETIVIPPDAGHDSTIADQADSKSIIQTLLKSKAGSIFCIDWKPATQETKNTSIEDIISEIKMARWAASGFGRTHIVGLCAGAWKSAIFAATHPHTVSRLSIIGGPIDFCIDGGPIQELVQKTPQYMYRAAVEMNNGIMSGDLMLKLWMSMHPFDRLVTDMQRLWNATADDKDLAKITLERAWYLNPQDIAGTWYLQAVDDLFRKNKLVTGELSVFGIIVNLNHITCPVDVVNGDKDDITLIPQCFALSDHVGTPPHLITKTILEGVGHIGSFVSSSVQPILGEIFSK